MPPVNALSATFGVPSVARSLPAVRSFNSAPPIITTEEQFTIQGVTRDSTGAVKANATVYLFLMVSDAQLNPTYQGSTISGASGDYSFFVAPGSLYWITDYKAGAPDQAGATNNNLTGV